MSRASSVVAQAGTTVLLVMRAQFQAGNEYSTCSSTPCPARAPRCDATHDQRRPRPREQQFLSTSTIPAAGP
jgi:hypothetical protein